MAERYTRLFSLPENFYTSGAPAVAAEVIDAFLGQGSVIKKRDDVHKMAQANKAFAHYAWGNNAG